MAPAWSEGIGVPLELATLFYFTIVDVRKHFHNGRVELLSAGPKASISFELFQLLLQYTQGTSKLKQER